METWVRDRELAGLPGWPTDRKWARAKARRLGLARRRASGRGGGYEYEASRIEPAALAALLVRRMLATEPQHVAMPEASTAQPIVAVTGRAREFIEAYRAGYLAALDAIERALGDRP